MVLARSQFSGHASQLSLFVHDTFGVHDVLHALGDARGKWDGERASFFTNSPRIASRVEGPKRRENLDSEVCEGLRKQASDTDHRAVLMHLANEARISPIDLTPQVLTKHSRRTEYRWTNLAGTEFHPGRVSIGTTPGEAGWTPSDWQGSGRGYAVREEARRV